MEQNNLSQAVAFHDSILPWCRCGLLISLLTVGIVFFISTHLRKIKILIATHGLGLVGTGSGHKLSRQTRTSFLILLHQLLQPETGSHTPPRARALGLLLPRLFSQPPVTLCILLYTLHMLLHRRSVTERSAEAPAVVTS